MTLAQLREVAVGVGMPPDKWLIGCTGNEST